MQCHFQHGRGSANAAYEIAVVKDGGREVQKLGVCRQHMGRYFDLVLDVDQKAELRARRLT